MRSNLFQVENMTKVIIGKYTISRNTGGFSEIQVNSRRLHQAFRTKYIGGPLLNFSRRRRVP